MQKRCLQKTIIKDNVHEKKRKYKNRIHQRNININHLENQIIHSILIIINLQLVVQNNFDVKTNL